MSSIRYEIGGTVFRFFAREADAQRGAEAQQRLQGGSWRAARVEDALGWIAVDDQGHAFDWSGRVPAESTSLLKILPMDRTGDAS